jgi:hypothetical protein
VPHDDRDRYVVRRQRIPSSNASRKSSASWSGDAVGAILGRLLDWPMVARSGWSDRLILIAVTSAAPA